jgi:hypothetical protein
MTDITVNEVRRRLQQFAIEHANDRLEKQYAQQFMRDFYACFGLSKSSASMFEKKVIKFGSKAVRFIDSFIPGVLLVEQKTTGEDLHKAYEQALDYALAITNEFEKPRYILICDFQTFHLYDLHNLGNEPLVCKLEDISKRANWFMFLVDKRVIAYSEELPVNRKAVEQIAKLHDALLKANYTGRDLESFLTRLLFCLFADDTGIFGEDGQFRKLVERTKEDGSDLGTAITMLFQVLNTPHSKRQTTLDERLKAFEYVNGALFEEQIQIPSFDFDLRTILVKCAELDWSGISPAIFGAMFQSVLESGAADTAHRIETRRELGAHYTSERNILKLIQPLFLDELHKEFEQAITKPKLQALYDKLHKLKFFDPACGCGNFLVIAYRELRRIENDVIAKLYFKGEQGGLLDVKEYCKVSIEQFYGIEIDEAAVHIARVAMYITDHQLNLESGAKFGETRATVPLIATPHIHHANALRTDWNSVVKANDCNYILGNPPFIGYSLQTKEQKEDLDLIFGHIQGSGVLDYVCAWYAKAARFIDNNLNIECAFVSTNSITQGEQPAILWKDLLMHGIVINFAHRTFKWSNEGRSVAAVHCVIIGFAKFNRKVKELFTYDEIGGDAKLNVVSEINAYLVNAGNTLLEKRSVPLTHNVSKMIYGSKPTDGGHLILTSEEAEQIRKTDPIAKKYIKKLLGADEFLNNVDRYCIWLVDSTAEERSSSKILRERIAKVKAMRLESTKVQTRELANTAYLFAEIRQTTNPYVLIPLHTSENRQYIPFGFFEADVICTNANSMLQNSSLFEFGLLSSKMHMAWVRTVCGRIKSDFRYSNTIVYNNFPFPSQVKDTLIDKLSSCANAVLDARNDEINRCNSANLSFSLSSMYSDGAMSISLVKAHKELDKAVDEAYGYKGDDDDASRVAFLFKRYEELTSLLPATVVKKKRIKKTDAVQNTLI